MTLYDRPRIHRYEVEVGRRDQEIQLGIDAPILHVASRHLHTVEFWALDDGRPGEFRYFTVYGTGDAPFGTYRGTAITGGGELVWHLYEDEAHAFRAVMR